MEKRIEKRIIWIDLARISAICLMMLYHLCGKGMWWATTTQYQTDYFSFEYRILIFFHMISRICIPVILMVSGMFMLEPEKETTIEKIFKHNILRIFSCLIFWNLLYSIYNIKYQKENILFAFRKHFIETHYHLVFLYALIGLYMVTPIIRTIVKNSEPMILKYTLLILFIGVSVFPTINMINSAVLSDIVLYIKKFFPAFIDTSNGIGYLMFYIMGYYLKRYDISKKKINLTVALAIVFSIIEVAWTPFFPDTIASLGYYDIGTILWSIIFVLWIKKNWKNHLFNTKYEQIIKNLSCWSFGAYLVHDFTMQFFINSKSYMLIIAPIPMLIVDAILVIIISFIASAILNHIPLIKNFFI